MLTPAIERVEHIVALRDHLERLLHAGLRRRRSCRRCRCPRRRPPASPPVCTAGAWPNTGVAPRATPAAVLVRTNSRRVSFVAMVVPPGAKSYDRPISFCGIVRKFDVVMLAAILLVAAGLRVWAPWDDVCPSTSLGHADAREFSRDRRVVSRASGREPGPQLPASHHRRSLRRARMANTSRWRRCSIPSSRQRRSSRRGAMPRPQYIERVAAFVPAIVGVLAVARRVGARDARVRSPRRLHRRASGRRAARPFSRSHARRLCRSPRARSVAVVCDAWRASHTARRSAPASASACICWRGRAARISSSSSRCGWC